MAEKRKTKDFNPHQCGVTHFLNKVGGKWKVLVIHGVSMGCNRFSLLRKAIPQISKQMLINQLRELEEDGILERTVFPEIPPRVEYRLSEYGKTLLPVIQTVQQWGLQDMARNADRSEAV
jgi:DNA-binding HxlR family transcriptional regulator